MRFTLVRHGETIQNRDRIIQGHLPGELSDRGKSQVHKTARELASTNFTHIYSSDLNRCKQTTKILTKHHEDTDVTYDKRLRELDFGDWEGLSNTDVPWDALDTSNPLDRRIPGGESMDEHRARSVRFINEKFGEFRNKDNILVVSHGGTIKILLGLYYSIPIPNLWAINTANAQAVFLDLDRPLPAAIDTLR